MNSHTSNAPLNSIRLVLVLIFGTALVQSSSLAQSDTVLQRTFFGSVTLRTISYNIYLPEGYGSGTERYPVVYHLHGLGGNQGGPQNASVPDAFKLARQQQLIGPVIIVFPNGYNDAFWANSYDSAKPAETNVVAELVPHIDSVYRTLPYRRFRIIQGFSMGGFGAAKFIAKFPHLFRACLIYDGAMMANWQQFSLFLPTQASGIFNGNPQYYALYDPYLFATTNAAALRDSVRFRIVQALLGNNQTFRTHVTNLQIPADFVQSACGHDIGCMMTEQGLLSAAFIQSVLYPPTSVGGEEEEVPQTTSLSQNYPNPFNPTTSIRFQIADFARQSNGGGQGFVSLVVIDVLGRVVKTLVNEVKAPGEYSVTLDRSDLGSGVYFYRLSAGGVVETKKLMLMK